MATGDFVGSVGFSDTGAGDHVFTFPPISIAPGYIGVAIYTFNGSASPPASFVDSHGKTWTRLASRLSEATQNSGYYYNSAVYLSERLTDTDAAFVLSWTDSFGISKQFSTCILAMYQGFPVGAGGINAASAMTVGPASGPITTTNAATVLLNLVGLLATSTPDTGYTNDVAYAHVRSLAIHRKVVSSIQTAVSATPPSGENVMLVALNATAPTNTENSGGGGGPTLTNPTGTGGYLTSAGSVTTDTASGVLRAVQLPASAPAPDATQIKNGTDGAGAEALRVINQAVNDTGPQVYASGASQAGSFKWYSSQLDSPVVASPAFTVNAGNFPKIANFGDPDGTLLSAATADGLTFVENAAHYAGGHLVIQNGELVADLAGHDLSYTITNAVPETADWAMSLLFTHKVENGVTAVSMNVRDTYGAYYYHNGNNEGVFGLNSPSGGGIASYSGVLPLNIPHRFTLQMVGTAISFFVQRQTDGKWLDGGGNYQSARVGLMGGNNSENAAKGGARFLLVQGALGNAVIDSISLSNSTASVPDAPTIGGVTAGNGSISVGGSPPSSNNGSIVTRYRAVATPGGFTATSATLPVTVPGPTNGVAYTAKLEALNNAGWSVESAASGSVTPSEAPTVPTLTSSPLVLNHDVLHLAAPFEAFVLNATTGALVVRKTSLTTHASTGVITFSDAALTASTQYRVVWRRTDTGAQGIETLAAS